MKNKRSLMVATVMVIGIISVAIYHFILNKNSSELKIDEEKMSGQNYSIQKRIVEKEDGSYNEKYKIYPDVLTYANVMNIDAYKRLYDAVENLEDVVDVSAYGLNIEDAENIRLALYNRVNFEMFYINTIAISDDGSEFTFDYSYSKESIEKMKNQFNKKVDYILNTVVKPEYTDLQKELAVYRYIRENAEYNHDESLTLDKYNAYSILVNGKGVCFGYANIIHYLLDRLGIESYLVTSDEPMHKWNIVKIDDEYYHLDATWETKKGLLYFNMTDVDRNKNNEFPKLWYRGNKNFKELEAPKCTSNRFDFLRKSSLSTFDEEWIYYTDAENKVYRTKFNGENHKKIIDEQISDMCSYKDYIYYISRNEENRLYKIKKNGKEKKLVDENIGVFDLKVVDGVLNYKFTDINVNKIERKLKLD